MNAKKITALTTAIIGLVIMLLGLVLVFQTVSPYTVSGNFYHVPSWYDAEGAAFGGDFYTYMYDASDMIVSELNEINQGMGQVVAAQNTLNANAVAGVNATGNLTTAVYRTGGLVIVAIGLAVLASAVPGLVECFLTERKAATPTAEIPAEEPVSEVPQEQVPVQVETAEPAEEVPEETVDAPDTDAPPAEEVPQDDASCEAPQETESSASDEADDT